MIPNSNILTVLPFYTDKKYQDRYKNYGYGYIFPLVYQSGAYPTHAQILTDIPRNLTVNVGIKLFSVNLEGDTEVDLTQQGSWYYRPFNYDNNYGFVFSSTTVKALNVGEGRYYIEVTVASTDEEYVRTYYSEVFTFVDSLDNYLKIDWWQNENMIMDGGEIFYLPDGSVHQTLYLPTEIGKPEYEFTEEGETRNGYFFAEKQISRKKYHFQFLATEYLCDALRLLPMHDYIKIMCNGITYEPNQVVIGVEWQEQGNLASVSFDFYCSTVAKKIAKATYLSGGDFNDDFNDDFNNEQQ